MVLEDVSLFVIWVRWEQVCLFLMNYLLFCFLVLFSLYAFDCGVELPKRKVKHASSSVRFHEIHTLASP